MGVLLSGSPNVTVNGKAIVRIGDTFLSNRSTIGTVIAGSPNVSQSVGVARVGDQVKDGSTLGTITTGSPNVMCNGQPVARVGDSTSI